MAGKTMIVKFLQAYKKYAQGELLKTNEEEAKELKELGVAEIILDKPYMTSLNDVYKIYDKWLKIDHKERIDILLAHRLTHKIEGDPVWLIIIAPSGDCKSEIAIALHDGINTKIIEQFTSKSLVSGNRGVKDLVLELNGKFVIVPDMAQLLHLHTEEKAMVWGQLRELYDGRAGRRTAMKEDPMYEGLKLTFLMCATPSIDSQILIFQHLGTRELLYRPKIENLDDVMKKILENSEFEKEMRTELKEITTKFISERQIINKEITEDDEEFLKKCATYIGELRSTAESDSYTGELRNFVYPEKPTRVLKQLRKMFIGLLNLDMYYSRERARACLMEVVKSSVNPIREQIINILLNSENPLTTHKIADSLRLGVKTVLTELNVLFCLNIVNKTTDELVSYNPPIYWTINKEYPYFDFLEESIKFSL